MPDIMEILRKKKPISFILENVSGLLTHKSKDKKTLDIMFSEFEKIGYETITAEEFNRLPQTDKNLVFEKHFLEDYLDSFINDHVKMDSMNTTGFLDNPGVGAGLYGQMKDWYMSTAGAGVFGQKIKEMLPMLPQR